MQSSKYPFMLILILLGILDIYKTTTIIIPTHTYGNTWDKGWKRGSRQPLQYFPCKCIRGNISLPRIVCPSPSVPFPLLRGHTPANGICFFFFHQYHRICGYSNVQKNLNAMIRSKRFKSWTGQPIPTAKAFVVVIILPRTNFWSCDFVKK